MTAMDFFIITVTAFAVATLTLFSGFGLGTLLMPAFAVFFPAEVAVAATAVVHLLNNLFKMALVGRHADRRVVLRFAVPAAVTALAGAALLIYLSDLPVLFRYEIGGRAFAATTAKTALAALIAVFALFELSPRLRHLEFDRRYLGAGGALSGFFGGLSGHQGALRSAFLAKLSLDARSFIGTNVVCAVVVDVARLIGYGAAFVTRPFAILHEGRTAGLIAAATAAAFVGSFLGSRLMENVTIHGIRRLVGVMLLALALLLGTGLV